MSEVIEAEKLKQIINKIETIEQERLESTELLKDAFNEAKVMGFDVKIIKHILKLSKKDKEALAEEDSLIDLYRGALGI
ncbi:MAG: GapR family DNA-binding domain-containing protein [Olleya sp.]